MLGSSDWDPPPSPFIPQSRIWGSLLTAKGEFAKNSCQWAANSRQEHDIDTIQRYEIQLGSIYALCRTLDTRHCILSPGLLLHTIMKSAQFDQTWAVASQS